MTHSPSGYVGPRAVLVRAGLVEAMVTTQVRSAGWKRAADATSWELARSYASTGSSDGGLPECAQPPWGAWQGGCRREGSSVVAGRGEVCWLTWRVPSSRVPAR